MRVLLSTYDSRGGVEPLVGLAVRLRALAPAAEGCDALVASGLIPAAAGARSVAEKLGIRYVYAAYCPIVLPSPHHPPPPAPGRPYPPEATDNRVLNDLNAQSFNARRAAAHWSPGWVDLALADDRDDCFAVGEVNQQALFARVAAVVHHGGAGTTTAATRAGAPQVVIPQWGDQPYWAGRVAATLLVDAVSPERPPVSA